MWLQQSSQHGPCSCSHRSWQKAPKLMSIPLASASHHRTQNGGTGQGGVPGFQVMGSSQSWHQGPTSTENSHQDLGLFLPSQLATDCMKSSLRPLVLQLKMAMPSLRGTAPAVPHEVQPSPLTAAGNGTPHRGWQRPLFPLLLMSFLQMRHELVLINLH